MTGLVRTPARDARTERTKVVRTVAGVALAGIDPVYFLTKATPFEQYVLASVASRVLELRQEERREQARLIAEQVVIALGLAKPRGG